MNSVNKVESVCVDVAEPGHAPESGLYLAVDSSLGCMGAAAGF